MFSVAKRIDGGDYWMVEPSHVVWMEEVYETPIPNEPDSFSFTYTKVHLSTGNFLESGAEMDDLESLKEAAEIRTARIRHIATL